MKISESTVIGLHFAYIIILVSMKQYCTVVRNFCTSSHYHRLIRIPTSATTVVSVWNTRVFRTALTALTEPFTLWRRITGYPSLMYLLHFVVTYTHHQNDKCVILLAGAAVMLKPFTQRQAMFMPFSGRVPHCTSPLLLYIGCRTLPIYVFEMFSLITIQSSLRIHRLPLHLLCYYRICQVWNILTNLHPL